MISKLKINIVRTSDSGIFHDSRKDIRTLASCINQLVSKVNELVDENNKLKEIILTQSCSQAE